MARNAAACLVVLLAIFEIGSCLRCYTCNSQNDRSCADTFVPGNQLKVDCGSPQGLKYNQEYLYKALPAEVFGSIPGAPRYCHKIVMASGTVIRTCLDGSAGDMNSTCSTMDKVTKFATDDKRIKHCSVCDKDDCNGAGAISFSLPLALAALFSAFMLHRQ